MLTAPGWDALEAAAVHGATVYVSFMSGVTNFQRGLWHHRVDAFFGVRHQLRYGLLDHVDGDLVWRLPDQKDLGRLGAGERLCFRVADNRNAGSRLPIEPVEAEVLAVDGDGMPALVQRRVGSGRLVLATVPVEYYAAARWNHRPDDVWRLYQAFAAEAGVESVLETGPPAILTDRLIRSDGTELQRVLSHSEDPVELPLANGWVTLDGDTTDAVRLEALGVHVLSHSSEQGRGG